MPHSRKENKLRKNNREITLKGKKAIQILTEIESMMISLRNIQKHYYFKTTESSENLQSECMLEVGRYVIENDFVPRLSKIRRIISEQFDHKLGIDKMDDTERAMEHLVFWQNPGD